jgi:hypothetical protein
MILYRPSAPGKRRVSGMGQPPPTEAALSTDGARCLGPKTLGAIGLAEREQQLSRLRSPHLRSLPQARYIRRLKRVAELAFRGRSFGSHARGTYRPGSANRLIALTWNDSGQETLGHKPLTDAGRNRPPDQIRPLGRGGLCFLNAYSLSMVCRPRSSGR